MAPLQSVSRQVGPRGRLVLGLGREALVTRAAVGQAAPGQDLSGFRRPHATGAWGLRDRGEVMQRLVAAAAI
jgi:hypothetical protein